MNLSLKGRITISFVIANLVVIIMGMTVFFFLESLNSRIEKLTDSTNSIGLLTDEIRISSVNILRQQKKILTRGAMAEDLQDLSSLCEGLELLLQQVDSFYQDVEVKKTIAKMQGYVDSLKTVAVKANGARKDSVSIQTISELSDKILDAFSEFQDIQYDQNKEQKAKVRVVISETRRQMLIILIVTFLGTILLGLIVPGKISLPFKKINDAIRELQDCNFDVSIYYKQSDEIGELALEINKMISNLKTFEELRTDRIAVENRKFDILANMVKKHVLVANAKAELIYVNNRMYSLLGLSSEDIIRKKFSETLIPDSIKDAFELAIKRRSKIENSEIQIARRSKGSDEEDNVMELVFQGHANVFPIRAKESSLDYYLMIVSEEVFT